MTKKKIGILGYGQIGKSIRGLYDNLGNEFDVYAKDLYDIKDDKVMSFKDFKARELDVLHVCIPYYDKFVNDVSKEIKELAPDITIIHSTVPIHTTAAIKANTGEFIVHSPVMGVHPNLTESIQTFTKIVGGEMPQEIEKARDHFHDLEINTVKYNSSEEAEMSKMLSTTYYGWNILFMRNVKKLCKENNLSFENVYSTTNEIYNEGYIEMGMENVIRPVLGFHGGKIGGHCVRPNFELLKNIFYPAKIAIELDDDETTQ